MAFGKSLSLILQDDESLDRETVLITLVDAGKLLTDLFHQQSMSRRALIQPKITDKVAQTVLATSPLEGYLFGKDLANPLKEAKALSETGKHFFSEKTPSKQKPSGNAHGLQPASRGRSLQAPPRKSYYRQRQVSKPYHYQRREPTGREEGYRRDYRPKRQGSSQARK